MTEEYDLTLKPKQNEQGRWDALDSNGWGHLLGYTTEAEAEAWIAGYDAGAWENR